MHPTLYTVEVAAVGQLSIAARPRGFDWLDEELEGFAAAGVGILASALETAEEADLGLSGESAAAVGAGLEFVSLPIPDRGVPRLETALPVLVDLAGQVRQGRHVAVHCRVGVGRSPLLVASVLVLLGADPERAWELVEKTRGLPVPDNAEQRAWVHGLARHLADTQGCGDAIAAGDAQP